MANSSPRSQRRFARYTARLAPGLAVYAPWTDQQALQRYPDRTAMLKAVTGCGLRPDPGSDAERSTDANLAGISHELAEFEDLAAPVTRLDPRWSRWPAEAAAEPEAVTVTFERGHVIDVDGSGDEPLAWMTRCNEVGARHGIWLRDVVERRIVGTVCRGVYEAAGLELLDHAWRRILRASLDASSRTMYDDLAHTCGAAMYEARWSEPVAVAARAAIDRLVDDVTGRVSLVAHRGVATVTGVEVASGPVRRTRFGSGGNRWS